ncbi:MAG: enoyl-CoA hydratase/isomerase family protein [Deltaproteobacteria bacterium]|jgi:enoyl-CoA hydratase/carnithine racemase|nr:enoyl-CoA hydratase/isomerase family protein [Deltaproteobacteria bacterium]MBW2535582.1 enoyl-CoA hydratase/isomerase family protein [Deltaproteobacteria bacterium]
MSERRYATLLTDTRELGLSDGASDAGGLPRGVHTIRLNNPARRNAIGPRMVNELLYALEDAARDERVRAVVLTGEGKAFCAGGDFAQMTGGADADELPPKGDYADLMLAMVRYDKPLVARVNGHALGGGLGLVAACHFALASERAKLGTPEVNVGLFPMMIMAVLRRIMPRRQLAEMMLLGQLLEAERAAEVGMIHRAVPPAELDAAVDALLAQLLSKSPLTLSIGLRAMADQDELDLADALPLLRERLGACLGTDDAREGLMAFLEKRPPRWTGT